MALVKNTLQQEIYKGLYKIFIDQSNKATSGDENEKPEDVIKKVATDMAVVISDAVDLQRVLVLLLRLHRQKFNSYERITLQILY